MPPPTPPLGRAFADAFGALARARGDRALHPSGQVFAATARFPEAVAGVPALSEPREVDALLRLSRAVGLRPALPDILGFALRLHDLHGPGHAQDLLLASSPPPPAHGILAPRRSFEGAWFTGLLTYRVGDRRCLLVAHTSGPGRFSLGLADRFSASIAPLAEIAVGRRLEPPPPETSSFDPVLHAAPELRQDAGALDAIRARAYHASRAGRRS